MEVTTTLLCHDLSIRIVDEGIFDVNNGDIYTDNRNGLFTECVRFTTTREYVQRGRSRVIRTPSHFPCIFQAKKPFCAREKYNEGTLQCQLIRAHHLTSALSNYSTRALEEELKIKIIQKILSDDEC